jgi:hypothetical protein
MVCSPIDEGGLGIRNVRRFNQALLVKWLWRFAHEEGSWWRSVLLAKYRSIWGGGRGGGGGGGLVLKGNFWISWGGSLEIHLSGVVDF